MVGRFICGDDAIVEVFPPSSIKHNDFSYCLNEPIKLYDPTGEYAIWLQDTDGVGGMGHTGLLLEDSNGNWYHLYWGPNLKSTKKSTFFQYNGPISFRAINKYYGSICDDGSYEKMVRIEGDFSKSVRYAKWLVDTLYNRNIVRYDMCLNNCVQVCLDVLCLGTFSVYDSAYRMLLARLRVLIVPNLIYNKLVTFQLLIEQWKVAPWYDRMFLISPQ